MRYEVTVGSLSWINGNSAPVRFAPSALIDKYAWVTKMYVGLAATANSPPGPAIDFVKFRGSSINFRSMAYCHFVVDIDDKSDTVSNFKVLDAVHDPGWTPPFDKGKFPTTYGAFWEDFPKLPYAGEASPLSLVNTQARHKNSSMTHSGAGQTVLVNSLIKFRAGSHTDDAGIKMGCPFHVPWVWCETLLTYSRGTFTLYGRGSLFPTHYWYLNGLLLLGQDQTWDTSLPWRITTPTALKIYPVISKGAPASGPQTPLSGETHGGPVEKHPNTAEGGKVQSITLPIKGIPNPAAPSTR